MIRGYNFPSGSEEKVTINGFKATENLDLFVHQHTMDFTLTENMPSIFSKNYFSYLSEDIIT